MNFLIQNNGFFFKKRTQYNIIIIIIIIIIIFHKSNQRFVSQGCGNGYIAKHSIYKLGTTKLFLNIK